MYLMNFIKQEGKKVLKWNLFLWKLMMHVRMVFVKKYFPLSILVFCWAGPQINRPTLCHAKSSTQVTYFILPIKLSPFNSRNMYSAILIKYLFCKKIDRTSNFAQFDMNTKYSYQYNIIFSSFKSSEMIPHLVGNKITLHARELSLHNWMCRNIILPQIKWGVWYEGFV